MNDFELNVTPDALVKLQASLMYSLEAPIRAAQMAMTWRLYEIIQNNFGEAGEDRPEEWVALSPAYAARVGRPHATLDVTGRLRYSIQVDGSGDDGGRVWIDPGAVPYALVHQFGGGNNIPARPYFPIREDGTFTPYTQAEMTEAAEAAFVKELAK